MSTTHLSWALLGAAGLGSAVGGALRFFVSRQVVRRMGAAVFPWATMAVNVSGAFLLGILAGIGDGSRPGVVAEPVWSFAAIGLLGGYTTVSALSLQTLALLKMRKPPRAAANLGLTLALGLAALAGGYGMAAAILRPGPV